MCKVSSHASRIFGLVALACLVSGPVRTAFAEESAAPSVSEGDVGLGVWNVERFRRAYCGTDPIEPFNRTMFAITEAVMEYVARPFCWVYCSILPKPLIKGIDNATYNSEYPERLVATLLRAEGWAAWDETRRFLINTTLGLGGLFDPAGDWFYIFPTDASLAGTFAAWGIPEGPTFVLPFVPNTNVRDDIGYLADFVFDPLNVLDIKCPTGVPVLNWSYLLWLNYAPTRYKPWESALESRYDRYRTFVPLMTARAELNADLWLWRLRNAYYEQGVLEQRAKALPEGSEERAALLRRAADLVPDVRPAVHEPPAKPAGLRGRWIDLPGFAPRSPALDTLRAAVYRPEADDDFWWWRRSIFNRDFARRAETRTVEANGRTATYAFVSAKTDGTDEVGPTRLAVVLPGFGSTTRSDNTLALSETLHARGYAVLSVDSLFNWRGMQSVNGNILPGNLPEDVGRLAAVLEAAVADLQADGCVKDPELYVAGWSMGGMTALHLAHRLAHQPFAFPVRKFVAVNPPVDLRHAFRFVTEAYDGTRAWSRESAHRFFTEALGTMAVWLSLDHPRYDPAAPARDAFGNPWDYAPNVTDRDARLLFAHILALGVPELISVSHRMQPIPGLSREVSWFSRREFQHGLETEPILNYWDKYLVTFYPAMTAEKVHDADALTALADTLRNDRRIAILHTLDDILVTEGERAFLDATLGDRITWFSCGGHCGQFNTRPFADALLERFAENEER